MINHENTLEQILRVTRAGRDFYVSTYPLINNAEVRTAFAFIAEVKSNFVVDLAPWTTDIAADTEDAISPAAIVSKMYSDVQRTFRSETASLSANALSFGEEQLLRMIERCFDGTSPQALKDLLKSYYPQFVICRDAMIRLRARHAA